VGSLFDVTPGYLNTASIGAPPRGARLALEEGVAAWGRGEAEAPGYDAWVRRAREAFGRLVGVPAARVAVGATVSPFVATVARALRPGDEVVGYAGDFTSVLFPLIAQERHGARVRLVELHELADAVTPRTALVAVSAVQSADGALADLAALTAAARSHDALLLVDATQACGWLPVDAGGIDVLACGGYKWLLGPRGTAFMAARPEALERLEPLAPGWYAGEDPWTSIYGAPLRLARDARRFDTSPAWLSWVGAAPALELIESIGVEAIHAHDVGLANRLRVGLGMPQGDSAIVSVRSSGAGEALARAGLRAAQRAGGARLSFHLYNTHEDVDRALEALAR
jgi:selenocysteine lyase/cysteine desulfurase